MAFQVKSSAPSYTGISLSLPMELSTQSLLQKCLWMMWQVQKREASPELGAPRTKARIWLGDKKGHSEGRNSKSQCMQSGLTWKMLWLAMMMVYQPPKPWRVQEQEGKRWVSIKSRPVTYGLICSWGKHLFPPPWRDLLPWDKRHWSVQTLFFPFLSLWGTLSNSRSLVELSIKMPVILATREGLSRWGQLESFLSIEDLGEGVPLQAIEHSLGVAGTIFMPHGVKPSEAGKDDTTK